MFNVIGSYSKSKMARRRRSLGSGFESLETRMLLSVESAIVGWSGISQPQTASGTIGWSFQVNEDVTVQRLGIWDEGGDGLDEAHAVTIWTDAGVPLGQAVVPSGVAADLDQTFRYVDVLPFVLTPDRTYVIGADYSAAAEIRSTAVRSVVTADSVTFLSSRHYAGQGFPSVVTNIPGSGGFFGPNFQFDQQRKPDLVAEELSINSQGDVFFSYQVRGVQLQQDTNAYLYWASGPTRAEIVKVAASPLTIPASAPLDTTITRVVSQSKLFEPRPKGATHLIVVVDEPNLVDEVDEGNNVQQQFVGFPNGTIDESSSTIIDIRPGSHRNVVNTKSKGVLSVAIVSTLSFDAPRQVDLSQLTFGRTGSERSLKTRGNGRVSCQERDVNQDQRDDLVCQFWTKDTGIQPGDTKAIVQGYLLDGTKFMGDDSIVTVGSPAASSVAAAVDLSTDDSFDDDDKRRSTSSKDAPRGKKRR